MDHPETEALNKIEAEERPTDNRDAGDWGMAGRIGAFSNHPAPDEQLLVETIHIYNPKN